MGGESNDGKFVMVEVLANDDSGESISPQCTPDVEITMACPTQVVLDARCSSNKIIKEGDWAGIFWTQYTNYCNLKATLKYSGKSIAFYFFIILTAI